MNNVIHMCTDCKTVYMDGAGHTCVKSLELKVAKLESMCRAAAAELKSHWKGHCNKDGYGPFNLLEKLSGDVNPDFCDEDDKKTSVTIRYKRKRTIRLPKL